MTPFKLSSPSFENGGEIPAKFSCQGKNISPELHWSYAPQETKSFALIVDDPDAPDPAAPKMTYVHWVLFNLPPSVHSLIEAVRALPPGTREGLNDWKQTGYGGPCPPIGRHRYFFKLYALNRVLDVKEPLTKTQLEALMKNHILSQATLMGTYQKSHR